MIMKAQAASLAIILLFSSFSVAEVTVFISEEVGFNSTASRYATDRLQDEWRSGAEAAGACSAGIQTVDLSSASLTGGNTTTFTTSGVSTTLSSRDMEVGAGVLGQLGGTVVLDSSSTLQGEAPRPSTLFTGTPLFFNEQSGLTTSKNAALYSFDSPVQAFGAWFGDLETSSSESAVLRLYDSSLNQIGSDTQITPCESWLTDQAITEANCGGTVRGCGNRTTRWVGFVADPGEEVSYMLVVVGDDNTGGDGLQELLSTIGPTIATDFSCASADLEVQSFEGGNQIAVTQNVNYSTNIINHGPNAATNVVVQVDLDAELDFVSASLSDGSTCVRTGSQVTCTISNLSAGGSRVLTVISSSKSTGDRNTTVTISGDQGDPDGSTNSASLSTTVVESINATTTTIIVTNTILCESSDLTATANVLDGNSESLLSNVQRSQSFINRLVTQGVCNRRAQSGLGQLVSEAEALRKSIWMQIQDIPSADLSCSGDTSSLSCTTTSTTDLKASLLEEFVALRKIVDTVFENADSCTSGTRRRRSLRQQAISTLREIREGLDSIPSSVTQCQT